MKKWLVLVGLAIISVAIGIIVNVGHASQIELNESLTITKPGTYYLTGDLEDGQILVDAEIGKVRLVLDNVSIDNAEGPAILCENAEELEIELVGENYLSGGPTDDGSLDGVIYSRDDLVLMGEGSLNVVAEYGDGIHGNDTVIIRGGEYTISAADDGIHGNDAIFIYDGSITIDKSYEGIEAQVVTIDGGEIRVIASDDGINTGGGTDGSSLNGFNMDPMAGDESCVLTINGGEIYVEASGDGIDSNGYLYFNGGTVIVDGPTNNGNGALDAGIEIRMNGGEVIALGSNGMAETLGANSNVNSISVYFAAIQIAGSTVEIRNASGEIVLEHTAAKNFSHLAAGTNEFKLSETYYIYINGNQYTDFTITDTVTIVGNMGRNQDMTPRR